jgi:hypothetical protein
VTALQVENGASEELSCGWAQLPLYQHDGQVAAAKVYDLRLHGGTPLEHEVMVGVLRLTNFSPLAHSLPT